MARRRVLLLFSHSSVSGFCLSPYRSSRGASERGLQSWPCSSCHPPTPYQKLISLLPFLSVCYPRVFRDGNPCNGSSSGVLLIWRFFFGAWAGSIGHSRDCTPGPLYGLPVLRGGSKECHEILLVFVLLFFAMGLATPFGRMLLTAIRYGLEQSGVNSIAHGIAWRDSFATSDINPWLYEMMRASWLLVALWAGVLLLRIGIEKTYTGRSAAAAYAVPIFFLTVLFVIRAAGRIDVGITRLGFASIWGLSLLLPLLLFTGPPGRARTTPYSFGSCLQRSSTRTLGPAHELFLRIRSYPRPEVLCRPCQRFFCRTPATRFRGCKSHPFGSAFCNRIGA